eukprot:TRINITY_DN85946_c0_g1_i1.p1 TRINITY_DN85946_c0_g1~~TRINITY_DN85946_c0_g1_i1.p1  ORF type:complete len:308 (+),score=67.80 TRINITY_DN85946_c0_g1_i1:119-1042(+)
MVACCRHRRQAATNVLDVLVPSLLAAKRAVQAAASAVGAAGGGWAVLAALRAVTGVSVISPAKCRDDLLEAADLQGPMPRHVAVIMDGNRRWGRQTFGDSLSGHRAGGEKLHEFIDWCVELGVEVLTVFAFSTENWKRDSREVEAMMRLFLTEVPRLRDHASKSNVRVRFLVSDEDQLPADVKAATDNLEQLSKTSTGLQLNVCLSYGGRSDVARACRELASKALQGSLDPSSIDDGMVRRHLLTGDLPDPDLLIRTSGEQRLSNFLMFQLAYAEMFFLEKHWPEVCKRDFLDIIARYQTRQRRYGK